MAVKYIYFISSCNEDLASQHLLLVFSHIDTLQHVNETFRVSTYNEPTKYPGGAFLTLIWVDAREILAVALLSCVPEFVVRKSASSCIHHIEQDQR